MFGGRIVKIALLFTLQILMARVLGRTSYGSVVLAMMVVSVVGTLSGLGINRGISRKLPEYEDVVPKARGVLQSGLLVLVFANLVAATVLSLAAPLLATRVFNDPGVTPLLQLGALSLPLTALSGFGLATAKSLRDARPHVLVKQILNPITRVLFVGGLVALGLGAVGAMIGNLLAGLVGAIVASVLAYRLLPFSIRGQTTAMREELVRFSIPLMLSSGAGLLMGHTDTFLLGALRSPGSVGVYNVAFQLQEIGYFFFYPVSFLLPPVLTRLHTTNQEEAIRRTYQVATKWMTLLTLPMFLAGFLFPGVIIGVTFGDAYIGAQTALRVLLVAPLISVILGANGKALVALGHNKSQMYVNGTSALLNVGLNLALIPPFGIVGAAAGTTTSLLFRNFAYTIVLYYWHSIHPFTASMMKPVLATAVLSPIGYAIVLRYFKITLITVVGVGLLFLALYVPLIVLTGGIEDIDNDVLIQFEESSGRDLSALRSLVQRIQ